MQEKIDNLKERIDNISNIIGDYDISDPKDKTKNKTINDIISTLKTQLIDNNALSNDTLQKSKIYSLISYQNSESNCSFIKRG